MARAGAVVDGPRIYSGEARTSESPASEDAANCRKVPDAVADHECFDAIHDVRHRECVSEIGRPNLDGCGAGHDEFNRI